MIFSFVTHGEKSGAGQEAINLVPGFLPGEFVPHPVDQDTNAGEGFCRRVKGIEDVDRVFTEERITGVNGGRGCYGSSLHGHSPTKRFEILPSRFQTGRADYAGWKTGSWHRQGFPPPAQPPKNERHATDEKKPQRRFVRLTLPGFQTRPLFFAEDLRLILNRLELNVKPLFLL